MFRADRVLSNALVFALRKVSFVSVRGKSNVNEKAGELVSIEFRMVGLPEERVKRAF